MENNNFFNEKSLNNNNEITKTNITDAGGKRTKKNTLRFYAVFSFIMTLCFIMISSG